MRLVPAAALGGVIGSGGGRGGGRRHIRTATRLAGETAQGLRALPINGGRDPGVGAVLGVTMTGMFAVVLLVTGVRRRGG